MIEGTKTKFDLPEGIADHESVPNPLPVKRGPNDYTSLPNVYGLKSWNDYEEWETYDNTEFRADENFKECWGDVDKLKEKFGEVHLININSGDRIRPEEGARRYCFGFDYAIAGSTDEERRRIKKFADNYRNIGHDGSWTTAKAIKAIVPLMVEIEKYPHIVSHFS